jgi:hypothetical protein
MVTGIFQPKLCVSRSQVVSTYGLQLEAVNHPKVTNAPQVKAGCEQNPAAPQPAV